MKIRTGFDIAFTLSQPTPMILMLSVHPARIGDLLTPQAIRFDPPVEAREYRDVFDNICHRIVAPPGQLTIAADFTVQDSGQPDPVVPEARQIPVQDLPDDVLIFLLGSRYCDTDKLSQTAWSLFGGTPEGWARVQAIVDYTHERIRFDYQRADLRVSSALIYRSLAAAGCVATSTLYTSCGMSSIAALLFGLSTLDRRVDLLVPQGCYGETRELIEGFQDRLHMRPLDQKRQPQRPAPDDLRMALVDSSVRTGFCGFTRLPADAIDLVLFDTTCFWRNGSMVRRVVDWALRSGLPLVLVRSHTKLDCLGVEYGRLGSVVFASALRAKRPGPKVRSSSLSMAA